MFLEENYSVLDRRLKDGEFLQFSDFETTVKNFEEFFIEHGPPGFNRRAILLEFLSAKKAAASEYFISTLSNEVMVSKMISEEYVAKLEKDIASLKEDSLKEKDGL